ncbi:MAG: hypothetical protein IM638_14740 [Bacteroidetes bacterium]|nr:hypothetical protein [Bacteroidota bacterium]
MIKKMWKFGILRSVNIDTNPAAWEFYDFLEKLDVVRELIPDMNFRVIGEIDKRQPIICKTESETVYLLYEMDSYSLIPLATHVENLIRFLDGVEYMWIGNENETILKVTDANLKEARQLIETFAKNNPGIDTDFWEMQCFPGLTLGFPL